MRYFVLFIPALLIACQSPILKEKTAECNTLIMHGIKENVKTTTEKSFYFDETGNDTLYILYTTKQYNETGNITKSTEVICNLQHCDTNQSIYTYKNGKLDQVNQNGKPYAQAVWISRYSFVEAYHHNNQADADSITYMLDSNYRINSHRQVSYRNNTKQSDITYTRILQNDSSIYYTRHNHINSTTDTSIEKMAHKDHNGNATEKHYLETNSAKTIAISYTSYEYYKK